MYNKDSMVFDFSQYTHSNTAKKLNIDNSLPETLKPNIVELDSLLKSVKDSWKEYCVANKLANYEILIVSGYRSQSLNQAVGGSPDSPHLAGYAADILPLNKRNNEFFKCVLELASSNKVIYDEMIVEGVPGSQWMHVAVKSLYGEQRKKSMKYQDDKLIPVTFASQDIAYGSNVQQETSKKLSSKGFVPENSKLDWTDEYFYNMSPEEIDNFSEGPELFSRNMLLTSRSGILEAEKRCLYIMKSLVDKLMLTPSQAAGIAGNIAYMTKGSFSTYRNSGEKYGICMWDDNTRDVFNKMHYKDCYLEEASLEKQVEFLIYTLSDRLVSKFQKCYDENASSNLFFSQYVNKKKWSDMFYGVSKAQEEKIKKEASDRRAYSSAALTLWETYSYVDVDEVKDYSGNGQDGPRMEPGDDSKIYVSDGDMTVYYDNEKVILEDDEELDPELVEYYSNMFDIHTDN